MARCVGRLCVSTVIQSGGAPLLDSATTTVEHWGNSAHGSVVARVPWRRDRSGPALVLTWRGVHAFQVARWIHPRQHRRALQRSRQAAARAMREPEVMSRAWGKIAEKRQPQR